MASSRCAKSGDTRNHRSIVLMGLKTQEGYRLSPHLPNMRYRAALKDEKERSQHFA
jgi:hypothetical protein